MMRSLVLKYKFTRLVPSTTARKEPDSLIEELLAAATASAADEFHPRRHRAAKREHAVLAVLVNQSRTTIPRQPSSSESGSPATRKTLPKRPIAA